MSQKVEGAKVLKVMEETIISEKFKFKNVILECGNDDYSQPVQFRLVNDKISEININEGDVIDASYNLKGRAWENKEGEVKFFNNLDIWSVDVKESNGSSDVKAEEESDFPF